jgi:hypothetical protein
LQQSGRWIAFAPGAFVWHHRRQTPRAYLRQQAGYGEAEALLRFKHPDKFNGRGDGKWRGVMYGASLLGLRLGGSVVYRGTFGTGLFQCVYQPGPAHWAMLPGTLEWHAAAALLAVAALFWPLVWLEVAALLGLSLAVAALQAAQAPLAPAHRGWRSRGLVAALCYLQPLVRSWARYRTRLLASRPAGAAPGLAAAPGLPLTGVRTVAYWTADWRERTELLDQAVAYLNEHHWGRVIDSGWSDWDLELHCDPWTVVRVRTAQEDHGSGGRLIRVRYRLRPGGPMKVLLVAAALAALVAVDFLALPAAAAAGMLLASAGAALATCFAAWCRGASRASRALALFDALAGQIGLVRCQPSPWNPDPEREGPQLAAAAGPPTGQPIGRDGEGG